MNPILKNRVNGWGRELLGCGLVAAGIYNFAVAAEFPMTGFSGISIILYRIFGVPVGLSTILLNVPLAFFCGRRLGKRFLISSLRCMLLSSLMIDLLAPLFPLYRGDRLLAALCTGVIAGLGYAMIYKQNSSTGGMDFIIMAVKSMRPHLSLGRIVFLSDLIVVLAGGLIFRDVDGVICGLLVSFLFAMVVDKALYGINAGKLALVITEKGEEISRVIDRVSGRGSTLVKARGAYSGGEKSIVICACSNKEMYGLRKAVKEADPASFVVILESNEVHGEGFRTLQPGEKE